MNLSTLNPKKPLNILKLKAYLDLCLTMKLPMIQLIVSLLLLRVLPVLVQILLVQHCLWPSGLIVWRILRRFSTSRWCLLEQGRRTLPRVCSRHPSSEQFQRSFRKLFAAFNYSQFSSYYTSAFKQENDQKTAMEKDETNNNEAKDNETEWKKNFIINLHSSWRSMKEKEESHLSLLIAETLQFFTKKISPSTLLSHSVVCCVRRHVETWRTKDGKSSRVSELSINPRSLTSSTGVATRRRGWGRAWWF